MGAIYGTGMAVRGLTLVVLAAGASGCMSEVEGASPCDGLVDGDVVITEVMANPRGPDLGHEWIELYNPGQLPISLRGLRIEASRADGTSARSYALDDRELAPGQWLVLGDSRSDELPPHLDISYGAALGALRNSDGRVALHCGETQVDAMAYERTRDGRALVLDGSLHPALARLVPTRWCHAAQSEYEPGNFGTPGDANEACEGSAPGHPVPGPDACQDDGMLRPRIVPEAGDLRISEVMANTSQVSDAVGEWFEVMATRDVDLGGLEVGIDPVAGPRHTLDPSACLRAEAGAHVLFARSADGAANGGLPPVDHVFRFFQVNSHGQLLIGHGGEVLDEVAWERTTAGTAQQRDDDGAWCDATLPYGDGDLGTPGLPNPSCETSLPGDGGGPAPGDPGAPEGYCNDGGVLRPVRPLAPGDLVINEVMPNTSQVPDATGEWFELLALRSVDLAGLEVGTDLEHGPRLRLGLEECHRVEAGATVLFARSMDSAANGGLPPVDHLFRFFLVNTNGLLFIGHGGEVFDWASWERTASGTARQRDADGAWCDAATPYGDGDLGTPGAPNPGCE
jgi:hypothetical protein